MSTIEGGASPSRPTPPDLLVAPAEDRQWADVLDEGVLIAVDDDDDIGFADFRWSETGTKAIVDAGEPGLKAIYVDPTTGGTDRR